MPAKIHDPGTEQYARGDALSKVLSQIIDNALPIVAAQNLGGYATQADIATALMIMTVSFLFAYDFTPLESAARFATMWQSMINDRERNRLAVKAYEALLAHYEQKPIPEC